MKAFGWLQRANNSFMEPAASGLQLKLAVTISCSRKVVAARGIPQLQFNRAKSPEEFATGFQWYL
jgi:hypothetical protein